MDKRTRLMVVGGVGLAVALCAAYMLWPSGAGEPTVDPAIVEAAAESSRRAQQQAPPLTEEEQKRVGRARPGAFGGGGAGE